MCADRNTAAHVYYDKIQRLIGLSCLLGITLCNCLLVKSMEDADTGKLRNAGDTCDILKLVNNYGINDI